jgi:hypothetical protein
MPATTHSKQSRGKALADRLYQGCKQAQNALLPGARDVGVIVGLTPNCTAEVPLENVLVVGEKLLVQSERIYRYGNNVVMEIGGPGEQRLLALATGSKVESWAAAQLANIFVCEHKQSFPPFTTIQFVPPLKFVTTLIHREPTRAALPLIKLYALRPIFDDDFVLRGPGWHAGVGILVHGIGVEPAVLDDVDLTAPAIDRLPPHLYQLLRDFSFKEAADLANAIAVLITGVIVWHFITAGKPVVLHDGNQPGLGKTLLVRVIGVVLDGIDPRLIRYTADEEELQKQICAILRGNSQSQVLIDNAKLKAETAVHSPVIEANSVAAEVSLRILGKSENYTRPNDLLWHLTMNATKASSDLISRGVPIRQWYEGKPEDREFGDRDPISYAREHRHEILGELTGMIVRWNQLGRPEGNQKHRLTMWAKIVGGIMSANGFPEFLTNLNTAAAEFNTALDALAALAEAAIETGSDVVVALN